jgi:hypothetical protein
MKATPKKCLSKGQPKYEISQNYPNPFNPVSKIDYRLPYDSKVTLKVYDITGKEVAKLVNDYQSAGIYSVTLDGTKLATGMYIYKIVAISGSETFSVTRTALLIK